jgi:hypothetical protein
LLLLQPQLPCRYQPCIYMPSWCKGCWAPTKLWWAFWIDTLLCLSTMKVPSIIAFLTVFMDNGKDIKWRHFSR